MSDRPWLEDGEPSLRAERELLKRLNAEQPPAGSMEQGWAALSAQISGAPPVDPGLASGPTQVAPHAASSVMSASVVGKVVVGMALAGGAWWGGTALWPAAEAPASVRPSLAPSSREPVAPPPRSVTSAPVLDPSELPVLAPERAPAVRSVPATTLAEEGKLLAEAHRLVQSGQPEQALSVLRSSQARYPRSVLAQEREVLTIEALYASGSSGAARQRAQQFLKRHPKSPHGERLQRFVD